MKAMTRAASSSTDLNSPRRKRRRSRIEKNSSTWFSQLAWVGVWWMWTCGWATRNSVTLGVLWAERLSAMQCRSSPAGVWATRSARKSTKLSERVEWVTHPATVPSWTFNPANNTAVPWRRYSNSRRTAMPGIAGRVGLTRLLACIPDFSSTDHTTAFSGGLRYRPHTSPAFSQKSGSWLVIHDSTCHGLRSHALQIRQHCDAEIGTP